MSDVILREGIKLQTCVYSCDGMLWLSAVSVAHLQISGFSLSVISQ